MEVSVVLFELPKLALSFVLLSFHIARLVCHPFLVYHLFILCWHLKFLKVRIMD